MTFLRHLILASAIGAVACGGGETTDNGDDDSSGPPDIIRVDPAVDATNVSIASRVSVSIPFDQSDVCRFDTETTLLTVTDGSGTEVEGSSVYFVDLLRVDFTPTGMFEYDTTYTVTVSADCAQDVDYSFTTGSPSGNAPTLEIGMGFRIVDVNINEPAALKELLEQFLGDSDLVVQLFEHDADSLRMLGGDGNRADRITSSLSDPDLIVYRDNAFLFPMTGTYKAPFFQIEGRLRIPILDDPGANEIVLERFEISGEFQDRPDLGGVAIERASIRAQSLCADVCAVQEDELQFICQNPETICDGFGNLNLIGTYRGFPNDLDAFQDITTVPADGATDVPVDIGAITMTFTRAVETAESGAVMMELWADGATTPIEPTCVPDGSDFTSLSATCTLPGDLEAATTYRVQVVAHKAAELTFSTQ